jgi:very-short-patch-repair endonuclease
MTRGELRRLHRGVYLVGPVPPPHALEIAAVLACGPGALLSHRSAAYLYRLLPYPAQPGPVHVTVPGRHVAGDSGLRIHNTAELPRHEIRERDEIPVTAPTRTLVDLAGLCTADELEAAVAEAFALRLTNREALLREIGSRPGRRGIARLRTLVEGNRLPARTRSAPERKLLKLLRAADIAEPRVNVRIGRWEVDFYWPDHRLVVEVDAYATHSSPRAFERDRRKGAELARLGLLVHRVTRRQIDESPKTAVREIRAFLSRGSSNPL